ncbi:unnamed protein product [Prorocentrum cordatum]|uniref:Uncharacterized protein n=1 Tax=Prorocentrum cordatum TaxID=2364126 RepID=A0ABN9V448_9DINO|nr:unnamed protein product [Polarella glacialis]
MMEANNCTVPSWELPHAITKVAAAAAAGAAAAGAMAAAAAVAKAAVAVGAEAGTMAAAAALCSRDLWRISRRWQVAVAARAALSCSLPGARAARERGALVLRAALGQPRTRGCPGSGLRLRSADGTSPMRGRCAAAVLRPRLLGAPVGRLALGPRVTGPLLSSGGEAPLPACRHTREWERSPVRLARRSSIGSTS